MRIIKLAVMLGLLLPQIISAQQIESKSVQLFKTDVLQAPQSECDYFPFLQMDLSHSPKTFLLALCEFEISWDDPENEAEKLEYTFSDLSLFGSDQQEFKPIGDFTADRRLSFIRDPKYSRIKANEKWGAKTVRFGALFVIDQSLSEFTFSFAGKKVKANVSGEPLPHPSDFAEIEIVESELIDSTKIKNSRLKRSVADAPELEVTLSNPYGKLLTVNVKIAPQAPNVMGGEYRYIFRPSDFMLLSEHQILRPLGFLSRDNFGMSTIYNLSRTSADELKTLSQDLTLVFAVQPSFTSGDLIFMDKKTGDVTLK